MVLTSASLSALILEGIKFLARKKYNSLTYDFPVWFYTVALTMLNAVTPFLLVWMGVPTEDPIVTMEPMGIIKYVVVTAIGVLISMFVNNTVISPLKSYKKELEMGG